MSRCTTSWGKELGAPVYELLAEDLGTTPTTELLLYASAGMYMSPEGYVVQAQTLADEGFIGYKHRPGIGPAGDQETLERLTAVVDDMSVMLDVHTWWKLRDEYGRDTVRSLLADAAEYGAFWVEEPVAPGDHDGYVELSDLDVPLAGGESEASAAELVELGRTGAVDFLQGDVRHHEGFTG